jgi:PiT family inorganic phosphate transporter
MFAFFLSSGLFLGWTLGANDASNVFGTAVGSRMIRFRTAAGCCAVFIVLGAVISGAGASETLGKLGEVNAVAGAFMVALAAGVSIYLMTKVGYPVSTSQAIVGAIIGWNFFSGSLIDYGALKKIVLTWIACPILSAVIAIGLYKLVAVSIRLFKPHMFSLDAGTRYGLLVVGAFGSYSLGANNIANVMGVFVPVAPFSEIALFGGLTLSPAQQLFFIGGLAIALGVMTYSRHVMSTVGEGLMTLSPVAAFVVVTAHSLVLFAFASQRLEQVMAAYGLPAFPLVPVSSSQAIVGAVVGIGLLKKGSVVRWRMLGAVASGWVVTPVIAGLLCFVSLFFFQNVFNQRTYHPVSYQLTQAAMTRIREAGLPPGPLAEMTDRIYPDAVTFDRALKAQTDLTPGQCRYIMESAKVDPIEVKRDILDAIDSAHLLPAQMDALRALEGLTFVHPWQLAEALAKLSRDWRPLTGDTARNTRLDRQLAFLCARLRTGD